MDRKSYVDNFFVPNKHDKFSFHNRSEKQGREKDVQKLAP